jgi:hypothetical protein
MPVNERTLELIQLAIDGEASEEERAELAHILAILEEARETDRALREVVERLESSPEAEPPSMRAAILQGVAQTLLSVPLHAQTRVSVPHRRRRVLAAVYAVAAAIVVGLAVERLIEHREHSVRPSNAAAAMAGIDDLSDWPVVTRLSSLTVRRQGDRFAVQPAMAGQGPLSVAWDGGKLVLSEVLPPADVQRDQDEITFADRNKQVTVILQRREGASGTAVIRILAAGREVSRTTINF